MPSITRSTDTGQPLRSTFIIVICFTGVLTLALICWSLVKFFSTRHVRDTRSNLNLRSASPALPMHGLSEPDEKRECVKAQIQQNAFYPSPDREQAAGKAYSHSDSRVLVTSPERIHPSARSRSYIWDDQDHGDSGDLTIPRELSSSKHDSYRQRYQHQDSPTTYGSFDNASTLSSPRRQSHFSIHHLPPTPKSAPPTPPTPYHPSSSASSYTSTIPFNHASASTPNLNASSEARFRPLPPLPLRAPPRKVRQVFEPAMPDELKVRIGETLRVVHTFDDGWCLVRRPSKTLIGAIERELVTKSSALGVGQLASEEATTKGVSEAYNGGDDNKENMELEKGLVPAWCFLRPAPGLTPLRRLRESSSAADSNRPVSTASLS